MTPERWQGARELFDAAIQLDPADAEPYLREQCGDDSEMFDEVRAMLEEHRRTGTLDGDLWQTTRSKADSQPVFSPSQIVAGRYRIVRYVRRGGMGEVYEAQHLLLPDRVALKTLLPAIASDEAMISRFKQEIQLARKIAHPNVCKVFDLESHQAAGQSAVFFLTMEFLHGETLSSRIQRQGRMRTAEALPLVEQMAEALDAAHRSGVIHRDFKPSNVMLVPAGEGVRAVITDFGLARGITTGDESTDTLSKNVAGTLDYMAPELLTGSIATFRSDIYALGLVAYEMVTGVLPFAGETPLAAAFLRAKRPVPSPRALAPDLDPKWEQAILRALDRDPGRRFATVREFSKCLRGEPPSVTLPLPSLTRRKVLASACVVAALAAGWMGWWNWSRGRYRLTPEAARLYQQGVDDIHAGAYFAATRALGQTVQLAPAFSPARARLAESWLELDLPEKAALEFLPIRRQDNSWLPMLDWLQIEAVDRTLTREFPAAVGKYEEMRKLSGGAAADLDVDLGRAYEKAGQPDRAIEAYRRAAEGPWHSAAAWLRLGVLYSVRKRLTESQAAFGEADQRYRQISNLEGTIELTLQRGMAANRAQQYGEATTLLRKAMEQAHDAGNLQQEISARLNLANVSYKAGDTDQAEPLAQEALAAAQANQMESLTIRGFLNLGRAHFAKAELKGAEGYFQNALALAQRTGSSLLVAQSQLNLASVHNSMSRFDASIQEAKEALTYFQPNRWAQETFLALTLIGRVQQRQGNYAAAADSFQRLLDESTKAQDRDNMAGAEEGLGDVMSATENYPKALDHYRAFLAETTNAQRKGFAARDCASTLVTLGHFEEALSEFAQADAVAATVPLLRPSLAQCRAAMSLSRQQFSDVISRVRGTLTGAGLSALTSVDLTRILGLALLRSNDRRAGLQKCEEAYNAALKLDDPDEVLDTSLALMEALLATHDAGRSIGVFHEIEPTLATHPESRWRAFALMARSDRQYADRANEALGQLETLWGHDAVLQYRKRPDLQELWPLPLSNSAKR